MCLPTTFSTDPTGPGAWVNNSRRKTRLDYVAISQVWLCCVKSARVVRNVVLAIADRLGHRLPRVDLLLPKDTSCRAELPA